MGLINDLLAPTSDYFKGFVMSLCHGGLGGRCSVFVSAMDPFLASTCLRGHILEGVGMRTEVKSEDGLRLNTGESPAHGWSQKPRA